LIIDFHTHVFPESVRENREQYFPSESAFRLLYESPKSRLVGGDQTVSVMDAEGVDVSVIFGFPWRDLAIARENNDYVLDLVARHPDRLVGFCCFDPASPGAEKEVERCLDAGLSGVGELAFYESGISDSALERLVPIMDLCRERQVPVLVHTNEPVGHQYPGKTPNTLAQIYEMIRRFPENTIVLAHWGGGIFFYNLLKKEVEKTLANVYFDTAASPYLYTPEIYILAKQLAGLDKILFGTDFPLLNPSRYFKEFDDAGLTREEVDAICGENGRRLLNL
jgi:uncharacterized protein